MAERTIRLEIDGVAATAKLLDEVSPETAEALWRSLPLRVTFVQSKWSGASCYFRLPEGPLTEIKTAESPVCSIYPGTLVVSPQGGEALIGHGASEYRRHVGTDYVSRVAQIVDNRPAFLAVLRAMRDEGAKQLTVHRVE